MFPVPRLITYFKPFHFFVISDSESKSNKSEKYDTIENSSKESSSYLSLINELNDNLDNVKKQSDNLNERLKKSEQDKEHWKVEYQLVQMKHDKLKKQMDGKRLTYLC